MRGISARTIGACVIAVTALTSMARVAQACSCASFENGAWDMALESDTIVVAKFTGAAECANQPPSEGCKDELVEAEIVELLKGRVQPGRRVLVPGTLGEAERVHREIGFEFWSSSCQRMRFAASGPEAQNRHLLFLVTSVERPSRRLAKLREGASLAGEGPYFERAAICQQPNAEPITGNDDPWYRFVKAAVAAQTQTPALTEDAFLESVVGDSSWLIRREAYLLHGGIEFRKNGVLDPDPRIRALAARSVYGPMFDALETAAKKFRRMQGRWPQSDEIAALTDQLPNGRDSRLVDGVVADPWWNPYVLRGCSPDDASRSPCEFASIGPDHVAGTADDVSSVELRDEEVRVDMR